jgi:hypothetical protein
VRIILWGSLGFSLRSLCVLDRGITVDCSRRWGYSIIGIAKEVASPRTDAPETPTLQRALSTQSKIQLSRREEQLMRDVLVHTYPGRRGGLRGMPRRTRLRERQTNEKQHAAARRSVAERLLRRGELPEYAASMSGVRLAEVIEIAQRVRSK